MLSSHELAVRLQREEEMKANSAATSGQVTSSTGSGVSLSRHGKQVPATDTGVPADSTNKEKKNDVRHCSN